MGLWRHASDKAASSGGPVLHIVSPKFIAAV